MSKQRSQLKFNIGDILKYNSGHIWQKIAPCTWKQIGNKGDTWKYGKIYKCSDDDEWISLDYTLISFKNYLNEIENSITDKGTN